MKNSAERPPPMNPQMGDASEPPPPSYSAANAPYPASGAPYPAASNPHAAPHAVIVDTSHAQQHPAEPPPSYDSIFGRMRTVRDETRGSPLKFCSRMCDLFFGTIGGLIWLGFVLAIPILFIVIGVAYWGSCNFQPWIPRWLVILGIAASLETVLTFFIRIRRLYAGGRFFGKLTTEEKKVAGFLEFPMSCVIVVWFCIGCYWVFSIYDDVLYNQDDYYLSHYCDATLYRFSFWISVIGCICFGFVFLVLCCCGCCIFGCCDVVDK